MVLFVVQIGNNNKKKNSDKAKSDFLSGSGVPHVALKYQIPPLFELSQRLLCVTGRN